MCWSCGPGPHSAANCSNVAASASAGTVDNWTGQSSLQPGWEQLISITIEPSEYDPRIDPAAPGVVPMASESPRGPDRGAAPLNSGPNPDAFFITLVRKLPRAQAVTES